MSRCKGSSSHNNCASEEILQDWRLVNLLLEQTHHQNAYETSLSSHLSDSPGKLLYQTTQHHNICIYINNKKTPEWVFSKWKIIKKKTEGINIVSAEPEAGFITMSAIV